MRMEQISQVDLDGVSGITMGPLNAGTSVERVKIDVAILQPGSSLPKHPAGREQVFYVVSGNGHVAGEDEHRAPDLGGLGRGVGPRRTAHLVGHLDDDRADHPTAPGDHLDATLRGQLRSAATGFTAAAPSNVQVATF